MCVYYKPYNLTSPSPLHTPLQTTTHRTHQHLLAVLRPLLLLPSSQTATPTALPPRVWVALVRCLQPLAQWLARAQDPGMVQQVGRKRGRGKGYYYLYMLSYVLCVYIYAHPSRQGERDTGPPSSLGISFLPSRPLTLPYPNPHPLSNQTPGLRPPHTEPADPCLLPVHRRGRPRARHALRPHAPPSPRIPIHHHFYPLPPPGRPARHAADGRGGRHAHHRPPPSPPPAPVPVDRPSPPPPDHRRRGGDDNPSRVSHSGSSREEGAAPAAGGCVHRRHPPPPPPAHSGACLPLPGACTFIFIDT